jgi:DNA-3-methyladenine glycosylase
VSAIENLQPLPPAFYDRDAVAVARDLVGCLLARHTANGTLLCRIVETEAYRHDDPASHSYRGPSPRNRAMFGLPGHAYVYFIYGMYDCFNAVCGPRGRGEAVLIRAAEPWSGLAAMWRNRYGSGEPAPDLVLPLGQDERVPRRVRELTSGPGRLCQALGITRALDGSPLDDGPLAVCARPGSRPEPEIAALPRVGISKAVEQKWRFVERGNPFASHRGRESSRG